MREILYRAFDNQHGKERERMVYSDEFEVMSDFFGWIEQHFNNMELMQFTGLLDKNGKKVFEGDIITINGWPCIVEWNNELLMYFVVFEERDSESIAEYVNGSSIEAIGNIFQHKDMLK